MNQEGQKFLLSVVTVTYNDKQSLEETCRSLSSQTLQSGWEHVVIDGASSDGSVEWYLSNTPSISSKMISEPDAGIFDAMNKGIREAEGRYICFLNAGDILADDKTLEYVHRELAGSEPTWAYGMARVVDERGSAVRKVVGNNPYSRRKHLLGRATICHQAVWMSRSLIEKLGGFDEDFGYAADYHLLIRAGEAETPVVWDRLLVDYLAGGVSDTQVYRQLWLRHSARVGAGRYTFPLSAADRLWTFGQVANVRLRKIVKPWLNLRTKVDRGRGTKSVTGRL